jgi:hypothetical protein
MDLQGICMKVVFLMATLILSTSCSLLPGRSYYEIMDPNMQEMVMFEPRQDFDVIAGDEGHGYRTEKEVTRRTPASPRDRKNLMREKSLEKELYELELKQSERRMAHYRKNIRHLDGVTEKLYFLRLPTKAERDEYLVSKGYLKSTYNQAISSLAAHGGDISIGMGKEDISKMWGSPERIDIAGNPQMENERWSYYRNGESKLVYFENGRVEGWANQ